MGCMFLNRNVSLFKKHNISTLKGFGNSFVLSWIKNSYSHFARLLGSQGVMLESVVLRKTPGEGLE